METVVSGIRPTGKLHLGNYFGAVQNFIKMQNEYNCYFFIADYHSLTTHPDATYLHQSVKHVLAEYIGLGLNPDKCTLYLQSDLPQTAELYLFLNMNAYLGELERVTSFKEKIRNQPNNINAGLLTYPVLMAADILIHKGEKVPVGKDQEQHLEMARTFSNRFNRLYNTEYFKEPFAFSYSSQLVKVPGLTDQGKMSKSAGENDTIYLTDDTKTLEKKIMKAVTCIVDKPSEKGSEMPSAVQNLFDLMKLVANAETISYFEDEYYSGKIRFGDMKKQISTDMETFIAPIRENILSVLNNDALISKIAKQGAEKANISANDTIKNVREIIGFKKFY